MPTNIRTIENILRELDRSFRAWRGRYFEDNRFSSRRDALGLVRHGRNPAAPPRRANFLAGYRCSDRALSNHEKLARHREEQQIHDLARLLANALAETSLLDHPDLYVDVSIHDRGRQPRLDLMVEGFAIHDAVVQLPTLLKRLQPKLDILERVGGTGSFQTFLVGTMEVRAPSAELALAKWAALDNPSILTCNLDRLHPPEVSVKIGEDVVREALKAIAQKGLA